jgi:hypothetical protein
MLCSVFCSSEEPAELSKNRTIYLGKLQEIENERNEKVKKLTQQYLRALDKLKVKYTKQGDLEAALVVKKAAEQLKPVVEAVAFEPSSESTNASNEIVADKKLDDKASKVVIHQTTAGKWRDAGVSEGTVNFYSKGKKIGKENFTLPWIPGKNAIAEIDLPEKADAVKIECVQKAATRQVGLAEVEIFDANGKNVALTAELTAGAESQKHPAACLVDGRKEAADERGNWVTMKGTKKAWVKFSWNGGK